MALQDYDKIITVVLEVSKKKKISAVIFVKNKVCISFQVYDLDNINTYKTSSLG